MKKKHAYLIMAHNDFYTLEKLLELIDDERNDIFIHIDSKCNEITNNMVRSAIKISSVYFLEPRQNIRWGGFTQVKCEISLIELALKQGQYEYYHILSGADLPIKNQDYIHKFFEDNKGKEFIGFNNFDKERKKISYFYFLQEVAPRSKKGNSLKVRYNNFLHVFFRVIDRLLILFQRIVNMNRLKNFNGIVCRGSNWVSITHNLAYDIIESKKDIFKRYEYTAYPDEIFIQTHVYNSSFKNQIYNLEYEYEGCLRHIDWERGWPYTFTIQDQNELFNSNKLFARKFNSDIDKEIIDYIYKNVKYNT